MYQALLLKQPEGIRIPGERTVYRVMQEIGLSHHPKRKPNGITKADREARKSDDLLKRDFISKEPLKKCVTDITEIKAKDGKLYVSAIFDCFDAAVLGLAMDTNMKAPCVNKSLLMPSGLIRSSGEQLFTLTAEYSIPAKPTAKQLLNTVYGRT